MDKRPELAGLPNAAKGRKEYWPRPVKGYETREERARRENRVASARRRGKQTSRGLQGAPQSKGVSGPELLMTMCGGDSYPEEDEPQHEMPYSPESLAMSPTKSLLQIPSPEGSPVPDGFYGGSPLSRDGR